MGTAPDLTPSEIRDAFNLGSYELVDELCKLSFKQLEAEDARIARLDGKASGLLAAAGISLSVVTSVGVGFVLPATSPLSGWWLLMASVVVAFACWCGVLSAYRAAGALKLTAFGLPAESEMLDRTVLRNCDDCDDRDDGLRNYRAHVGAHVWRVYRRNRRAFLEKSQLVERSQQWFARLLVSLLLLGLSVFVLSIAKLTGAKNDRQAQGSAAPAAAPAATR